MTKKYYLITPIMMLIILLIPKTTKAASSIVSSSGATAANGETISAQATAWTSIFPDEVYQTEKVNNSGDIAVTAYKWNLVQNIVAKGLRKGKYYNGYFNITYTTTPSLGVVESEQPILATTEITQGVHAYIYKGQGYAQNITIVFDNYLATETWIGLPSIQQSYYTTNSSYNYTAINFTTSIAIASNVTSLVSSDFPTTTGLCGQMWTALTNAIEGSNAIADIFNTLELIRSNDLNYYTQLTNQLSTIIQNQNLTYSEIVAIFNEIDTDFQAVQTVLDLFPSYRTQVLQYWQELLQMNSAQSSAAAEVESQYSKNENTSNNLLSGMGSITMPSLVPSDINILENVDSTQKTNFFGMLSTITNTNLITTILLIIVTAAIAGYILYGKK